jgi:hypothetical protein
VLGPEFKLQYRKKKKPTNQTNKKPEIRSGFMHLPNPLGLNIEVQRGIPISLEHVS